MRVRMFVMTPVETMLSVFTNSVRPGDIELCDYIKDYPTTDEILRRVSQAAPDWICIDPLIFQNHRLVDCTSLIKVLKKAFPAIMILAFPYGDDPKLVRKCLQRGADVVCTYDELSVETIRNLFAQPLASNKLTLVSIRLIPQSRIMKIEGSVEASAAISQATVEVRQSALWRLALYLAFERSLNGSEWLVRRDTRPNYFLVQGAIWDALGTHFPGHQRYTDEITAPELYEQLTNLIDKPRTPKPGFSLPPGPATVDADLLAVEVNQLNDLVYRQLCKFVCDPFIKGPKHGPRKRTGIPLCYQLTHSIPPQNVAFVDLA